MLFLSFYLNTERISTFLESELSNNITVEFDYAGYNALTRTLKFEGLVLSTKQNDHNDTLLVAEEISFNSINFIQAIRGKLSLGKFAISEFTFFESNLPAGNQNTGKTQSIPSILIKHADLKNGTVYFNAGSDGVGKVTDINIIGGKVSLAPDKNPLFITKHLGIGSINYTFWDERYHFFADSILYDHRLKHFFTKQLHLTSLLSEQAYFESLEYRVDLVEFDFKEFSIEGINITSIIQNQAFFAHSVTVNELDLHITSNVAIEHKPNRSKKSLPVEAFQKMDIPISIDSIVVRNGDIRYSEYAIDSVRPGTVQFGKTNAIVLNVNNRTDEPIVLKANTFIQNTGDIDAEIRLSHDKVNVTGSMKTFDIKHLNSIFMDLVGIEIKDGVVHALNFEFEMHELDSSGVMNIVYDDLKIRQINKDDHKHSLIGHLTDFIVNEVVIRPSSRNAQADAREGEISASREPEHGFFKYLWISLRSGIFDIIKH